MNPYWKKDAFQNQEQYTKRLNDICKEIRDIKQKSNKDARDVNQAEDSNKDSIVEEEYNFSWFDGKSLYDKMHRLAHAAGKVSLQQIEHLMRYGLHCGSNLTPIHVPAQFQSSSSFGRTVAYSYNRSMVERTTSVIPNVKNPNNGKSKITKKKRGCTEKANSSKCRKVGEFSLKEHEDVIGEAVDQIDQFFHRS